ncbi:trypsin-like serine peptidase [Laceyella putida]|uniref:Serine protease n=1 Tax=Laceyella putida TaxID=110101 RepID=A0ABW2RHE2_9BACL
MLIKKRMFSAAVALSFLCSITFPFSGYAVDATSAATVSPHTPVSNKGRTVHPVKQDKDMVKQRFGAYTKGHRGTQERIYLDAPANEAKPQRNAHTESVIGSDNRTRVTDTASYPYSAIVHIVSDIGGCTGWLIGPDTVATAGHCIYDPNNNKWASSATVYPGRDGDSLPYGSANGVEFFSVSGWVQNGDSNYDYGAIKLDKDIGNATGWFGYRYQSGSLNGTAENISGYPGDKTYGTQWQHADQIRETQTYKLLYANDTYGGQSGSPVYQNSYSDCGTCAIAIHTNGVYGGSSYNRGTRITQEVYNNLNTWKAQ